MALAIVDRENSYLATLDLGFEPDGGITVSLIHDWGAVVVESADPDYLLGDWTYTFSSDDLVSSGVHRIRWNYTHADEDYVKDQFVEVVQRYVDETEFFTKYPSLETEFGPHFDTLEATTRRIIDTFCGQNFQFIKNGTLTFEGNGTKNLFVGRRLDSFSAVLIGEDSVTSAVSGLVDDDFDRFLTIEYSDAVTRSRFTDGSEVTVVGDWGYPYVPSAITVAAEALILELMSDQRVNYTHGIDQLWMDSQRTEFKEGMFDTTGNIDVDTMLMDYMIVGIDYV